jgi:hypothetical protein
LAFSEDSIQSLYYASFAVNSKTHRDIPEKTTLWFNSLGDLLDLTCILTGRGKREIALACFEKLFYLIDHMSDDIAFAHELGTHMLWTKYDYQKIYAGIAG